MKVGVIGAGGYAGGELLRLLAGHPEVGEIVAGSESLAGKPVTVAHPNLRKRSSLQFVRYDDVSGCDVLFLSLPNGAHRLTELRSRGTLVIDLSSDHRLRDAARYREWYDGDHPHPELLDAAVYGIPELHRDEIRTAKLLTGAGCNATATLLALLPLARAGSHRSVAAGRRGMQGRLERRRTRARRGLPSPRTGRRGALVQARRPPPHRGGRAGAGRARAALGDRGRARARRAGHGARAGDVAGSTTRPAGAPTATPTRTSRSCGS